MQDASTAFDTTMATGAVVWTGPQVQADWDGDGYGASGTIDDLTPLVGSPTIAHFIDDGLPDEVSFVSDTEAATATMPLVGGRGGLNTVQYWSPFQPSSPLYGYDRDIAPVTVDLGAVTEVGQEVVRVFTGQMADTPVKGRAVTLDAVSATRLQLAKVVQPPVRAATERGLLYGLTAAWPVVWALNECGIYAAPPAVSGCRLWVPLHGSGQPFIPGENRMNTNPTGFLWCENRRTGDTVSQVDELPTWVVGPYVGAFEAINQTDYYRRLIGVVLSDDELGDGDDWLSQTGSCGRVQFYVRGDVTEIDDVPNGVTDWTIGATPSAAMLAGLALCNGNQTGILVGVNLNRHVFIEFRQSSSRRVYHSTAPIVLTDDYNRTTANGFGTATTGQTYTSFGGAAGDRSTTTAGGGHGDIDTNTVATNYAMVASAASPDQEVSAVLRVSALPASGTLSIGVCARATDASNYYRAELQIATTGAITARMIQRVAGVETTLQSGATGLTYIAATDYVVRMQVIGTTIRMKLSLASAAEGSGWGFETYDNTALTTGNLGGVYCRNDSAATTHIFSWDSLEIRDLAQGQVPTDGAFHFIGTAWDIANNKLWVRLDNSLTAFTPSTAMSTAGLPTTNVFFESDTITGIVGITSSDLQFSTGTDANADVNPIWIHDTSSWTRGAIVSRSILDLEVVAVKQPVEAWDFIGSYAASEYASRRTDELDRFLYLTVPYWAADAQQTVVDALATATNAEAPTVSVDLSKVRNSVRVEYDQTRIDTIIGPVVVVNSPIVVPPGTTQLVLGTSDPATRLYGGRFYVLSEAQVTGADVSPPNPTYVVFNTAIDGSGAYADPGPSLTGVSVYAEVIEWTAGQVLIQFTNLTGTTFYTVHPNSSTVDLNFLQVSAYIVRTASASETVYNDTSIAARGERSLPVTLPQVQSQAAALRAAAGLLGQVAFPVPVVDGLSVYADPRRQPGDLVTFDDADESGASGVWRLRQVKHVVNGADVRQTVILRRARQVGGWGSSQWGDSVWGL